MIQHTRSLLSVGVIALALAAGCGHDDGNRAYRAGRTTTTTGGDHGGPRVTTRDTDHNGRPDTVAVRDDHRDALPTAMDQSESAGDLEITRQIRSAVVGDSSLSFGARNCVITTQSGVVTLQGDVTHNERESIVRHAQQAAGVTRVNDRLNVTDAAVRPAAMDGHDDTHDDGTQHH
jgi:hypothetical protein